MHCFFFCSVYMYKHIKYKGYEVKAFVALAHLVCIGEKNATKCCSFGLGYSFMVAL